MSNISRATNNTKSSIFQKLFVIISTVGSIIEISNDEFIQSVQYVINTEHGKDMISRGVYGK